MLEPTKIVKITEVQDNDNYGTWAGHIIEMSDGAEWEVSIQCGQSCCENYGYGYTSADSDDVEFFIGATLLNVNTVDINNNVVAFDDAAQSEDDYTATVFVNFETDRGLFQLTVYNSHNGYYGHSARVMHKGKEIVSTDL